MFRSPQRKGNGKDWGVHTVSFTFYVPVLVFQKEVHNIVCKKLVKIYAKF